VFVLGPDKGMELVESRGDVEALIIDAKGEVKMSSGFGDLVDIYRGANKINFPHH
jgi:thiamine biosynthesis lipoprotein ApbE